MDAENAVAVAAAALPAEALRGRCDIVVPVYEGVNYVRDLLTSIDRCTTYPYRVLLIDDSANDRTHEALLDLVSEELWIELHRNPENLGFVQTANRGFDLSEAEFICLMNSDTIVTPGWLERLIDCAQSDPRIAVVNPLSNMAVNLSVPMAPGLNLNTMASALAARSRRDYPDITTAVGFCMLIKRRYLSWLGGFDPIYGHGYCEESDLCMRYTEAGLRVVAADDAFVYHKGCGSFGVWLDRYAVNRRIFDARWQDAYESEYQRFLTRNPLQYIRDRLMRHSIREEEWTDDASRAVTRDSRKVHMSHLTGGKLPLTKNALRAGLVPNRTLGRSATADRLQRTPRTPP
ncbi:MAG: glycosyltransferase, partial [Actinomycetota bacterium]